MDTELGYARTSRCAPGVGETDTRDCRADGEAIRQLVNAREGHEAAGGQTLFESPIINFMPFEWFHLWRVVGSHLDLTARANG